MFFIRSLQLVGLLCLFMMVGCSNLPLKSSEKFEELTGLRPQAVKKERKVFTPRWIKNHDPLYSSGNLPIGLGAPLIYRSMVFSGHDAGPMKAYSLDSGRLLWKSDDKQRYHAAPVAYEDNIIYGTVSGRVISREANTGQVNYEVDLGSSIEGKGVVANGRVLFHLRNHQLFCLDVETGKILWAYKRAVPFLTTLQRTSTPLVVDNKVFVGFADGHAAAFSLEDGLLLWEQKISTGSKFVDVDTDPILLNNQLYMGSYTDNYTILDPQTGAIIHKLNYTLSRSALQDGENLLLGTADGEVVRVSQQLRELNKVELDGPVTSLSYWSDKLIAATSTGKLYALNPESLKVEEVFKLGHSHSAFFAPIETSNDRMVVYSSRNRLYAF